MPHNQLRNAAVLLLAGLPVMAQVHNGSRQPAPAGLPERIATARAQFPSVLAHALSPESVQAALRLIRQQRVLPDATGVTNFDNVSAPCLFEDTVPLSGVEQFAAFFAPAPNGGAILNTCSGFGVEPHSEPNFLAFNADSFYATGVPKTPELIFLGHVSKSSVSFWVSPGDNPATPVAVVAYGSNGVLGVLTVVPASGTWIQVTIPGEGIVALGLTGNPTYLLVDDLQSE